MKLLKIGAHMKNNIIEFQSKEMEEKKKINKKKLIITIIAVVILLIVIISTIIYCFNKSFRNFLDVYLFRKNIAGGDATVIDIGYEANVNIIENYKYISI